MERKRNNDGTYAKEDYSKEIGKKYGMLTINKIYRYGERKAVKCICICDCGNTFEIELKNLIKSNCKHCGCMKNIKDEMVGKKIGKLLVIERISEQGVKDPLYRCLCECGNYTNVYKTNLGKNMNTKSCGCIRKISQYNDNISKANTSGVKGVYYEVKANKWVAKLTIKRKIYKKRFYIFEDAVKYRKYLEEKYHKLLKEEYYKYKR